MSVSLYKYYKFRLWKTERYIRNNPGNPFVGTENQGILSSFLFQIVPSLSDDHEGYSLRSHGDPNQYVTAFANKAIITRPDDGSADFKQQATWYITDGLATTDNDNAAISFKNGADEFIRYDAEKSLLVASPKEDTSAYLDVCTFEFIEYDIYQNRPKGNYWKKIDEFTFSSDIAVGSSGEVWAILEQEKIVKRNNADGSWEEIVPLPNGEEPVRIECSEDNKVFCISEKLTLYQYNQFAKKWFSVANGVYKISAGNIKDTYLLTTTDSGSYPIDIPENLVFNRLFFGNISPVELYETIISTPGQAPNHINPIDLQDINVGIDGTMIGITSNPANKLVRINNEEFQGEHFIAVNYSFKKVSVASSSQIIAVTTDNRILNYVGENQFHEESKIEFFFNPQTRLWETKEITGEIMEIDHNTTNQCFILVRDTSNFYRLYQLILG